MKILKLMVLAALLQASTSCSNFKAIKGSGNIITTDRHLTGYNAIKTCCGIDVIITQAETESVQVEVDDNLQPYIKTDLQNQTLNIYIDSVQITSKNIKVHVQAKKLSNLQATSGSGIQTANQLVSDSIQLLTESGADMKVNISAEYISCETSSGADAILSGQTVFLKADVSSGANIKARDLTAETCMATASSGANLKVKATSQITAEANSGADISIYGNPPANKVTKDSGGRIKFE
jgi:hypothetical protein